MLRILDSGIFIIFKCYALKYNKIVQLIVYLFINILYSYKEPTSIMINISIQGFSGFIGLITGIFLARITFRSAPNFVSQNGDNVTFRLCVIIPMDCPLNMITYHQGFLLFTIPVTLWDKVKTMTSLDSLNVFLCKELERQELAAHKQAEAEHKKAEAEHKKAEAKRKKAELKKKLYQEKQDALKKEREEKKTARLQEKEKFKKKAPTLKTKYVLIERDPRLQCHILLERIRIIKVNYEKYDFSGKRPNTCLSMLEFNLQRALKTGQPLQRFINSATKHLQRLCPTKRVVIAQ